VVVITIDNGGHVEPSKRFHYPALYTRIVGVQNQDFEAVEESWSFFKTKSNP
jgi:poly(3-hydroxybutyrate) depolymerase